MGLDFSNDIVRIKSTDVITLFDRMKQKSSNSLPAVGDIVEARYMGRDAYLRGKITNVADDVYDIDYDDGSKETKVKESMIRVVKAKSPDGDLSSIGAHVYFQQPEEGDMAEELNCCETLLVSAERRTDGGVSASHFLIPITIGRSSVPIHASQSASALSNNDYYKVKTYEAFYYTNFGRHSAHFMCLDRSRSAKAAGMKVQRATVVSKIFASKDSRVKDAEGVSSGAVLVIRVLL